MSICLPKEIKDTFIRAVKDGRITPEALSNLSGEERNAFFEQVVGKEAASTVNALFESKLLLKNQEQGFITAIKEVAGLKPAVQKDLISKIQKLGKVLDPAEKEAFMQDLASQKLGTSVTVDEAKKISELATLAKDAKSKITADMPDGSAARIDYGTKDIALNNYVNELKLIAQHETPKQTLEKFGKAPLKTLKEQVSQLAGIAKGIKASLDNSAIFRQGWKTLFTNPQIWGDNAAKSFVNIAKQLGKEATDNTVIDGVKAEIISRQNAINGIYKDMKLDIGNLEEAFPTTLPEKIPLFGRLYKASETAYTGFLYKMRADIADKMIQIAKETGVDITNKSELESIGKLVNSLTGRGNLGSLEKVGKDINTVFFSPKMLKANLDFLTAHQLQNNVTPFVRKQAAINLLKVTSGIATILSIAYALDPKSVEWDPRSADFGKIRVGNTRFDVSGGMGSLVTLASRQITSSSKSSTTGKVTKLGERDRTGKLKFGTKTRGDVMFDFMENKYAPLASVVKDLRDGQDFNGNKPTLPNELNNLLTPLPIQNLLQSAQDPKHADLLLIGIADGLGISTNTYGNPKKNAK